MFPYLFLSSGWELMLKDEGYKLMGATFEFYNQLGYGMAVFELKAVSELISDHEAQLFNYMRISRSTGWLPDQLRPQRRVAREAVHPVRPARAGNGNTDREH